MPGVRTTPAEDRFFGHVDARGICWEWQLKPNPDGYGKFTADTDFRWLAHRWCWEHLVGPIPAGMTLDHLCLNKMCVNPDHLEVVTKAENSRRARSRDRHRCRRGHSMADAYIARRGRECRTCRLERERGYYTRRKDDHPS